MMRLLGVTLVGAMLLAGCAANASGASTAAPVDTNTVQMAKSYVFAPTAIRVATGETVSWVNDDNFTHTVRVSGPTLWQSQAIAPGERASYALTEPGDYAFECTLHPSMKGTIIVAPR